MPMDFDTSIMEQVQSSNLYPFLTQKDMDHLFQFFSLPGNEVNLMAISHLYTLNDYKQLGKPESFSFLSDPSSYLAGVPEEFQECFRKIYENNVNSKYGQDEEYFPLPKQMPLIVSPCYNISMTHPCKSYCTQYCDHFKDMDSPLHQPKCPMHQQNQTEELLPANEDIENYLKKYMEGKDCRE